MTTGKTIVEEIAYVDGAGYSQVRLDYTVVDHNPIQGTSYYRLKQTDYDGDYEYSGIAAVQNQNNAGIGVDMKVFPNPVICGQPFNIMYDIKDCKAMESFVVLYDVTGKEVFSKVIMQEENNTIFAVDPSNKLRPGIYLLVGSSNSKFTDRKKIVITEGNWYS